MTTTQSPPERTGAVTFKGQPITLIGPGLKAGDGAPDFALTAGDLSSVSLDQITDGGKRAALLVALPSLDTPVCNTEAQTFNKRLASFPTGIATYVVSMDLPFAQGRWCGQHGDVTIGTLSDYRDRSFGENYGVLMKGLGLLARAVFLIGADKKIAYVQMVPEVTSEPDYDAVIAAVRKHVGG
ncbi:MAG: thiol peroxidase [Candidatus Baltobacteraceae bacterium]